MGAANDIHCPAVVQSYETGFQRIQEATGITDIDKLVNKFIEGWSGGSRERQTLCQSRLVVAKTSPLPSPSLPSLSPLSPCAVEDQNFALFNYVNELNNEIEALQEQIAEVCSVSCDVM